MSVVDLSRTREEREEARFRAALRKSWEAAYAVGIYLHRLGGRIVQFNPLIIRPRQGDAGYGDDFDIRVFKVGDPQWQRLEVKGKKFNFTCEADFPYDSILLDRTNKPVVEGYFIVSDDKRYAAVILGSTREHWKEVTVRDGVKGYAWTGYECPKRLATFVRLADD